MKLLYCEQCAAYTMKETHDCGTVAVLRVPPKWSPEDKYGKYRREARMDELKKKGLV
ncbi:MAG TPA: nucleolar RNA-binding Nop10p family protein [Candidatus Nanoarchaeia archaeon]|nr:nucleolar RNA-binding Nop10p family protein [Candidatus Nanoarchaeia archaeon]